MNHPSLGFLDHWMKHLYIMDVISRRVIILFLSDTLINDTGGITTYHLRCICVELKIQKRFN